MNFAPESSKKGERKKEWRKPWMHRLEIPGRTGQNKAGVLFDEDNIDPSAQVHYSPSP